MNTCSGKEIRWTNRCMMNWWCSNTSCCVSDFLLCLSCQRNISVCSHLGEFHFLFVCAMGKLANNGLYEWWEKKWFIPVRHVIEVFCKLSEIGALLFVLFLCPQQDFRDLQTEVSYAFMRSRIHFTGYFMVLNNFLKQPVMLAITPIHSIIYIQDAES